MEKIRFLILLVAVSAMSGLQAQQAVTSSGGDASGIGGTASYSTGQIAYTAISGTGGMVTQGVQQPYEFFVLGKDDYASIKLFAVIYPNPVVTTVSLRIEQIALKGLIYELYDMHGKLYARHGITNTETLIHMEKLEAGIYILRVYTGMFELKTFKIIKKDR